VPQDVGKAVVVTSAQALAIAIRHHKAGQLAEAERVYRQVLASEPGNAEALHLLGIVDTEVGRLDDAVAHLSQATRIDPTHAGYFVNLGEAHRRLGNLAQATACNQRAVELAPGLAGAHANLGQLHQLQGDRAAALACFRTLVRLLPDDAPANTLLGKALLDQDELEEAERHFRRATELAPNDPRTHFNLGAALQAAGRLDEAAAAYRAALARNPVDPEIHNNLATVLQKQHALDEAERHYRRAIAINPRFTPGYANLAGLLSETSRNEEAVHVLRQATASSPNDAAAHAAYGAILHEIGWLDDAAAALRRAIALDPKLPAAYHTLAVCAQYQGRLDEAFELYRTSLRLAPDNPQFHSNYIYALNYHPDYDARRLYDEHCAWSRRHADRLLPANVAHANDRSPDRKLRVGYVSSHFRGHAVNFFIEPILAAHDHQQCEVFCYSGVIAPDETTARLRSYADHWREFSQYTDAQAAALVREDQIDVLVDLAGHIGGNRLLVFARKPAPVQVTYLGYQNTTGMRAMDYRLTDAWADPPGASDAYYTERLVRLPRSFFCYLPSPAAPPVSPLPALERGYVTFGSFNNFSKVTPQVLAAWARLLAATPNARLAILTTVTESLKMALADALARLDVASHRIELHHRRPRAGYLELISSVDIALDPFPFNGHTTTCDALWQGVPVLTLAGSTYHSRFGSSAHVNLDLADWIATSPDQYVEIGARRAAEVDQLAVLRSTLRERMAASALLDHRGFTRNLEAAYRQMWVDWCAADSACKTP
jgi:predicted O-linked N-acetylglucosamine transferase (SPINDLY family)